MSIGPSRLSGNEKCFCTTSIIFQIPGEHSQASCGSGAHCVCENYTVSNIHLLPRGHGLKGLGVKWIHSYYWVEILLLNYGSNPAILGKNLRD